MIEMEKEKSWRTVVGPWALDKSPLLRGSSDYLAAPRRRMQAPFGFDAQGEDRVVTMTIGLGACRNRVRYDIRARAGK